LKGRPTPVCCAALLLALTACASAPPPAHRAPADQPAPAQSAAPTDVSYDWHGLMLVPFGTQLKSSPVPLHEVLLFHDESQSAGAADVKDCYTVDGAPPRFLGRDAEEYLLCFRHDNLNRIDASVRVDPAEAERTFVRACAMWLKNATPTAGTSALCEGRDGEIVFSARLADNPGETAARVSVTLTTAAEADSVGAAAPGP